MNRIENQMVQMYLNQELNGITLGIQKLLSRALNRFFFGGGEVKLNRFRKKVESFI